jgi:hypothetical protein
MLLSLITTMSQLKINKVLLAIGYFMAFIMTTVIAHWSTVNLYVYMCAPLSWFGPFQTMISLGSPMCHFLNSAQTQLAQHYITLWSGAAIGLGTWIATSQTTK